MDGGSFSGSAGGCRGWFRHRRSRMHPVPMALRRSRYPVRFQQFLEAYVGQADLRCELPHWRRPSKPVQVIKRDTVMAPAVHSPWMPDRPGPGKRLAAQAISHVPSGSLWTMPASHAPTLPVCLQSGIGEDEDPSRVGYGSHLCPRR